MRLFMQQTWRRERPASDPCIGATAARAARGVVAAAALLLLSGDRSATGATFLPIQGSLDIRAGGNAPQSTPAVIGDAVLSDSTPLPLFNFATSSLQTARFGGGRFNFSAAASSSTTDPNPPATPGATASLAFQQSFTTAAPQWIQVTANVLSPPGDAGVSSNVTFGLTGQPALYSIGHTASLEVTRNGLLPAGSYTLSGGVTTRAVNPPAHAGALSGFVLIAELGDFNGDSVVGAGDLATWRAGFGTSAGATFAQGNLDGDNDSDGADFLLWQRQVGTHALTVGSAPPIPEPSGLALALIAASALRASKSARRVG